jgi:hypothetical protein
MFATVERTSQKEGGAGHQAKLVDLPRAILKRRVAMTAAERRLIERNLDLIFEFEKYVLEHPEVGERNSTERRCLYESGWRRKV